jgi:hypothetical protein
MLYSYKNNWPEPLPERIRLSDGSTRTDKLSFTENEILDAGYIKVESPPVVDFSQVLEWTGTNWHIRSKNSLEKDMAWIEIRRQRQKAISQIEWKYFRYNSQLRLGITPTDNIEVLDKYVQALRDITKQEDPFNIVWPSLENDLIEADSLHLLNT